MTSDNTSLTTRLIAIAAIILGIVPVALAATVGEPVQVSPEGHIVAEFSVATWAGDPQLMVASAIDSDLPIHARCAVYISRDGGATWTEVPVWPQIHEINSRYDPWVAIDSAGTLHAACIVRTTIGSRVGYAQSSDQGATWTEARTVTPYPGEFRRNSSDKSAFGVSPDGTVYVCYNQIVKPRQLTSELMVSRSDDGGLTWDTRWTNAGNAYCNGVVATDDGIVTVTYIMNNGELDDPLLLYGTVTSTNGGQTWHEPVTLGDVPDIALPSIVRDAAGRIVIAELAGPFGGPTHLDITVEGDDGLIVQQWQIDKPPSATCTDGRILHPSLVAPPSGFPALQVGCKISPTETTGGRQEVWLYPEIDQPGSVPPPILVSGFDLPAGPPPKDPFAIRFADGGDYWFLTWTDEGWLSMWVDPRDGQGPGALWAVPVSAD